MFYLSPIKNYILIVMRSYSFALISVLFPHCDKIWIFKSCRKKTECVSYPKFHLNISALHNRLFIIIIFAHVYVSYNIHWLIQLEREYFVNRFKFTITKYIMGNDSFRPYYFRVLTSNALYDQKVRHTPWFWHMSCNKKKIWETMI